MKKNKLGQKSAYPSKEVVRDYYTGSGDFKLEEVYNEGMSKRFYAACAAMQGLLANKNYYGDPHSMGMVVRQAYELADEILEQENL